MARRGKRGGVRARAKQEQRLGQTQVGQTKASGGDALASANWSGAGQSERRGYVKWTAPESKNELKRGDRVEILRKARWGYANIGLVRRIVDGLTNLVGYLTPQSLGADAKLYEAAWKRRAGQAGVLDMMGKLDAQTWQRALTRMRLLDGDNLTVLGTGANGGARILFYEAYQFDSGRDLNPPADLHDGVYLDGLGKHLAYRLVNRAGGEETYKRVEAKDTIYHGNEEAPGRVRNVSSLAHAIANIVDIVEILGDTKHGIKVAALWGVVMRTQAGSTQSAVGQELAQFLGSDSAGANADGDEVKIQLDEIVAGGRVQSLPPGASMETLQDSRPHPNQLDLLRWLVRDIAWGVGLSPEVLWEISGLNGTATRYVMAETRRWVECQQALLQRACQRLWVYFLSKEISAGRLPVPSDPDWWVCDWVPQADLTIDRGRDTAAMISMLDKGLISRTEIVKGRGRDFAEIVRELEFEKSILGGLLDKPNPKGAKGA